MQEERQQEAQEVKEKPVNPLFINAAIDALSAVIPSVNRLIKGSDVAERNQKVAELLVSTAKDAVGAVNEQELVESLKVPESVTAIQKAVEARWFDLVEAGGGGIAGARKAAVELSEAPQSILKNPAFLVTLMLLPLVYVTVGAVYWGQDMPQDLKIMTVTAIVSGVLSTIMGFWLGTSMSSAKKTDLLSRKA
jgi:hypothetical protein